MNIVPEIRNLSRIVNSYFIVSLILYVGSHSEFYFMPRLMTELRWRVFTLTSSGHAWYFERLYCLVKFTHCVSNYATALSNMIATSHMWQFKLIKIIILATFQVLSSHMWQWIMCWTAQIRNYIIRKSYGTALLKNKR